ncbi:MAG: asparagine synthase (glutamine-hydrolyzing) [Proteobacteria bacterium]|nr:asparagine synthase (glutamine-hydrolyzing) [Pseudomonadota bacterium]
MCGIAGIFASTPLDPGHEVWLQSALSALRHRGPDDQGAQLAPSRLAALGHTRLSILDLSPAGHQPMATSDGRYTIVFNGEIYNYREIRRTLLARGAVFRSNSDTEVILRAYEAHGPACVEQLRGMFAFALWDEQEQTGLLARDPFGIKPLYYSEQDGRVVFASELRALLTAPFVPRTVDAAAVNGFFLTGSVPEPRTLLKGVGCLEAGHLAVWRRGRLAVRKFWELRFAPAAEAAKEAVRDTRRALLDSVEHHFISDVPVGVFLSGGIDSTALLGLAHAAGRRELHTCSIAFPGLPNDEGGLARQTAAHFGTHHHEWQLGATEGRELFTRFLQAMDQPSVDGLNTFTVSQFARAQGLKVVLSGLGGDELFGGYKSFRQVPRLAALNRRLRWTGPLRHGAQALLRRSARPPLRRLGEMLGQPPGLATAYAAMRGIFTASEAALLTRRYLGVTEWEMPAHMELPADPTTEDTVSRLELTGYMRNQLLRDSDVMSMAHGLELRVPFLDLPLAATLARIPAPVRLQPGKGLLLQAVPEIPGWITRQPKRGFAFPFEKWLGAEWSETFAALDRTCPVPLHTWYRKWAVFTLEKWLGRISGATGSA